MESRMRIGPSTKNSGGEYGSPHMSIPMKGDIWKIEPLENNRRHASGSSDEGAAWTGVESREMGHSPPSGSGSAFASENSDGGYQSTPRMPQLGSPKETQADTLVSHHRLPQSRQFDTVFRGLHADPHSAPMSWSNVVSSNNNAAGSPERLPTRSSSGETLLTSNMAQQPPQPPATSFHYLGGARSRSQSFEEAGCTQPHQLAKAFSFGNPAASANQSGLGIPPSHPGHSSYKDSTLHSPNMMYPQTPYQDFKPNRSSMGSYSPISMGDMTDQTSPMSSPSLSPHVSPSMHPRKHQGDGPPPMMWQLSDNVHDSYHPEAPAPHHHRYHVNRPQGIPEHHASYASTTGPASPPRHLHSSPGGHPHQLMYSRSRAGKLHPTSPSSQATGSHHRSPTEVLKTLLRKKACLYEPETSFAVALVTWLVGRRLAMSRGYFTRQHLQAGVHSCVASKIEQGHVTRTKVNRCMQVILNSCFHYIIPRPDGSEECGEAFRTAFSRAAADEEHLLGTLPPPWDDLALPSMTDDESLSSLFRDIDVDHDDDHRINPAGGKPRSDSLDSSSGGKRSVLLCFNENIRSASDVFRCHNEFIRDVAHTGSLYLSREDWQFFFSGTKAYRKRGGAPGTNSFQSHFFQLADMQDRMDREGLSKFRTSWCAKRYDHDHSFCAFAHVDVNRGWLRRDPLAHNYKPVMCPCIKPLQGAEDCYVNMCPNGVNCNHAHSKEEILYHPETYKRQACRNAPGSCPLGDICPKTHADVSFQGYGRQGKRHYHDHSSYHRAQHSGPKRRVPASASHSAGFDKLPDGSPMLYIDPAPLSEFEKTLVLPGLQAMFRDRSSFVYYSTLGKLPPYNQFGYCAEKQTQTPS